MKKKPTEGYIGIDIGSHSIKIAQVKRAGGQLEIMDAAIVERQSPWELDSVDQSLEPQSSLNEIRAALSIAENTSGRKTALTASMGVCDIRGMLIELTNDDAINRSQIKSKFGDVDRFDVDARHFDYCPIPAAWRTNSANLHALSLRKDWGRKFSEDQSMGGFNCQCLDGLPFVMARAAQLAQSVRPGEPVAIIDWGYQRTTFCLAIDGESVFVRMLRGSGFRFALNAICEMLNVKEFEASQLVQRWGIALPDRRGSEIQAAIDEAASFSMSIFASELARTWDYLKKIYSGQMPRKVLLSGAGSVTNNISPWLAAKFGLLVEPWKLPGGVQKVGPQSSFPTSLFGPAIALSALAFQRSEVLV